MSLPTSSNICVSFRFISLDWFVNSLWVLFSSLFCMLGNFLSDARHCELYIVGYQTYLYFSKHSLAVFWAVLFGNNLILFVLLLWFVRLNWSSLQSNYSPLPRQELPGLHSVNWVFQNGWWTVPGPMWTLSSLILLDNSFSIFGQFSYMLVLISTQLNTQRKRSVDC